MCILSLVRAHPGINYMFFITDDDREKNVVRDIMGQLIHSFLKEHFITKNRGSKSA